MRSEGMGRAAWEPQFLALAEQGEGAGERRGGAAPAARADQRHAPLQGRRRRPRPLRLRPDRRGPLAADRHRRPGDPPRRLPAERGRGRRAGRARRARWRPAPTPTAPSPGRSAASRWAASARRALEGLSDHLLALRAVLEGQGPVGASLPMRAAALIADDSLRPDRGPRADRARARAGALADERRAAGRDAPSWPAGSRRASAGSCARPPSASSAPTSAPPPTRP